MGWHFSSSLATVDLDYTIGVDWEALVWIDYNTEQTRVGLCVSFPERKGGGGGRREGSGGNNEKYYFKKF